MTDDIGPLLRASKGACGVESCSGAVVGSMASHVSVQCQGMTSFLFQSHLGVFPTPTLNTFSILQTLITSQFQRHFGGLPIPSPFQQSPTLPHAPSTPIPHLIPPPKAALRPLPPPKVTWGPLPTLHPPIQTLLQCSPDTLGVVAETGWLLWCLILRVTSSK